MINSKRVEIETPFGPAQIIFQGLTSAYISNAKQHSTLTINRVDYNISFHVELYGGTWNCGRDSGGQTDYRTLHMSRMDWLESGKRDPSFEAREKAADVLLALLNSYTKEHPQVLVEAERIRLQNEIARCQEKRREAWNLAEEAQKQVDQLRNELVAISTSTGQVEVWTAEGQDLSEEMCYRLARMDTINEREYELQDFLAQAEGRRGACARYLTREEILKLANHLKVEQDDLSTYLVITRFHPSNGVCFEVPLTWQEAQEVDNASTKLDIF